jgi:hypothetical protein
MLDRCLEESPLVQRWEVRLFHNPFCSATVDATCHPTLVDGREIEDKRCNLNQVIVARYSHIPRVR